MPRLCGEYGVQDLEHSSFNLQAGVFQLGPTEGGTPWDFPFSLSFSARASGLATFYGRNFSLERRRGREQQGLSFGKGEPRLRGDQRFQYFESLSRLFLGCFFSVLARGFLPISRQSFLIGVHEQDREQHALLCGGGETMAAKRAGSPRLRPRFQ